MSCCAACERASMRGARAQAQAAGGTAGAAGGASVGGSIGGPAGAWVGGTAGGAIGGHAAGRVYDVAARALGGGGKNAVELDAAAYQLAPLADWIDEALWRGASWPEVHAAQAEGDRVTASLDRRIDPDAVWPGLPNQTIRHLERALAVQRLVSRYQVRPGRPARTVPVIGRVTASDVAPSSTASRGVAVVIGAIAGAAIGAGGAWVATRAPRRRRYRVIAMGGAGMVGALAGYGGSRWLTK